MAITQTQDQQDQIDALEEILEDSLSGSQNANSTLVTEDQLRLVADGVLAVKEKMLARYQKAIQREEGFDNPPSVTQVQDIIDSMNLDLSGLFQYQIKFNDAYVVDWDVSKVQNMANMFNYAFDFDQDISGWEVGNVTNMGRMFASARAFNQDIGDWEVSKVTDMSGMFFRALSFDQDLAEWNVSSVTNMYAMFSGAKVFNQNIGGWAVDKVQNMKAMFENTRAFNQDIGGWNVSGVTDMKSMFFGASAFNQGIGDWDVSSVTNMAWMFRKATAFDQDIGDWDISSLTSAARMLDYSGMSQENFDALLAGWSTLDTMAGETAILEKVLFGARGLTYTDATSFHRLDDYYDWTITGASLANGILVGDDGSDSLGDQAVTTQQIIHALGGSDKLYGGAGNDILVGGAGDDTLTGGAGFDRFVYKFDNAGDDVITDFDVDKDILDLSQLLTGLNEQNYDLLEHITLVALGDTTVKLIIDPDSFSSGEPQLVTITLLNQNFDTNDLDAFLASLQIMRDRELDALAEILEDSNSPDGAQNANGEFVTEEQLQEVADRVLAGNATMLTRYRDAIKAKTGFSNLPTIEQVQAIVDESNQNLSRLFWGNSGFNNSHVVDWDVSQVEIMRNMFDGATAFTQDIGNWDVGSVTDMFYMFNVASTFNQDIGRWDVSNVEVMHAMFALAFAFNRDIGDWDVSSVTDMHGMFYDATAFNQDLSDWDITSLTDAEYMLNGSGMSQENFDKLLAGWSTLNREAGETAIPMGITLGASGLTYTDATSFYRLEYEYDWSIVGATLQEGVIQGTYILKDVLGDDGTTVIGQERDYEFGETIDRSTESVGQIINSLGGDDTIYGGTGDDILNGGTGEDAIYGGAGNDIIDGGEDDDIVVFVGDFDEYSIDAVVGTDNTWLVTNTNTQEVDTLTNVETLRFDDGDHILI